MGFGTAIEYVACALFVLTAAGGALMVVELFDAVIPTKPEDERDDLAIW